MQYCLGGKKSRRVSLGSDFTEQIFTGELSGVHLTGVLSKGVQIITLPADFISPEITGVERFENAIKLSKSV